MIRRFYHLALYIVLGSGANAVSAQEIDAYLTGDMRAMAIHTTPVAASDISFVRGDGAEGRLADYHGQYVLLNFWATWCAPCRHEMPSLDTLQRTLGGDNFAVVTLATGRNPPQAIRRFFEEIGITALPQHRDINQQIAQQMGVFGLPITVLLNPDGQEIARLRGDADWASEEAMALINALITPSES